MKLTKTQTIKTATPLATTIAAITAGTITLLALASTAHAKIHETYAQSVTRYGEPSSADANGTRWNINDDFCVIATFNDPEGRCDTIRFLKWDGPYSEKNLQSIVKFNIPSNHWYLEVTNQVKATDNDRFWIATATRNGKDAEESVLYQRLMGDATTGRDPFCISIWSKGAHQRADAAAKQNDSTPTAAL
jgi:hypothetical protein